MKQNMMRRVLHSLIPIVLGATYFFGLRTLLMLAVVTLFGVVTEYLILRFMNPKNVKVTEAVLVTCYLYVLTLPAGVPYWVAVVGIVFGVLFGKGVFGGFGRNVFNPALVGRCFIYISFPKYMTMGWLEPFSLFPGGLLRYLGVQGVTGATPLTNLKDFGMVTPYSRLLVGNIGGSLGETSAILILLAAVYLIYTKTASWKIMASTAGSFLLGTGVLYLMGVTTTPPLFALLSGGVLFATVFMATDPISAPNNELSKVLYGVLIGLITVIIRTFALFTEGVMFAILIANTFAPLIDRQVKELQAKRQVAS